MAKILENTHGRRQVRLSADDILSVVTYYQSICRGAAPGLPVYQQVREVLSQYPYSLPEEM
ncbi:MAG: hypothetical protein K2X01_02855 [Cyanobacteria bacterium]|nr:hypothetical protein [Cyanobacteriota bacterium]